MANLIIRKVLASFLPVVINHAGLDGATIQTVETKTNGACTVARSFACGHGTFVTGILNATRGQRFWL